MTGIGMAQVAERRGGSHYGAELQEGAVAKAKRLVREGMAKREWTETDLALRRKGDRAKLAPAVGLRSQTTMTLAWIAARLRTGAGRSNLLSAQRRKER